jgi:uncharacterized integral membrane protein
MPKKISRTAKKALDDAETAFESTRKNMTYAIIVAAASFILLISVLFILLLIKNH